MDSTHLDMAEAVADVALRVCPRARWSVGHGVVGQAERTADGIVVSKFVGGRRVASHVIGEADVTSCIALARRSAA